VLGRLFNWFRKSGAAPAPVENAQAAGAPGHRLPCQKCGQPATLHITEASFADRFEELHLCEPCAFRYLDEQAPQPEVRTWNLSPEAKRSEGIQSAEGMAGLVARLPVGRGPIRAAPGSREVRLRLGRVVISEVHEQQVIMLKEVDGERRFYIVIGIFEAVGIDRAYKQLPSPRPLTHDAWLSSLLAVGARVQAVCISGLQEHTYYATLRLQHDGQLIEVDMRPSDAVLMALKANAPLFIPEHLLDEVCWPQAGQGP
jgi:bifunctional DNase/RNase